MTTCYQETDRLERVRIQFTITTKSPLHIGSGLEERRQLQNAKEVAESNKDDFIFVKTIVRDQDSQPYIPASSFKGQLRQRAQELVTEKKITQDDVWDFFGVEKIENDSTHHRVGSLLFRDAYYEKGNNIPPVFTKEPPMDWDSKKYTYILRQVAIDRVTSTGLETRLFHHEVVPTGTIFCCCIDAIRLSQKQLSILVALLNTENSKLSLGGRSNLDFGNVEIQSVNFFGIDTLEGLNACINDPSPLKEDTRLGAWQEELPQLDTQRRKAIEENATQYAHRQTEACINITLRFEDPFLVNDPSQCKEDKSGEDSIAHTFLKNEKGCPFLPASSFRGPFRAQAERILRTLSSNYTKSACLQGREGACSEFTLKNESESKENRIPEAVQHAKNTLCMACQLFGTTGWHSPLRCSDFTSVDTDILPIRQEMVAIDRFTGGAAGSRKFNVVSVDNLTLKGSIYLNLNKVRPAHLGLLILVLRDLQEGDIAFGFGTHRGFGGCTAQIDIPDSNRPLLKEWLKFYSECERSPNDIDCNTLPLDAITDENTKLLAWFLASLQNEFPEEKSNG